MKFFYWSICFSKGGNWAWYSVDVDGGKHHRGLDFWNGINRGGFMG